MLNFAQPSGPVPYVFHAPEPAPFAWMKHTVGFISRRMVTLATCAALGLAAGVSVLAVSEVRYTATATLMIDSRRVNPIRTAPVVTDSQSENVYVESQVELLRSPGMIRRVAERLHLDQDPRFAPAESSGGLRQALRSLLPGPGPDTAGLDEKELRLSRATQTLSRLLDVRRVAVTSLVEVRAVSPDRQLGAELANTLAEVYVEEQLGANSQTVQRAGDWLEARLKELRAQAVEADRAVQEYKAEHGIVDTNLGLLTEQQLSELNVQLAAAVARLAEAESRLDRVRNVGAGGVIQGGVPEALQSTVITRLRQQYLDTSRRESEWAARLGPNHGVVRQARTEMEELDRAIQMELGRIIETHQADAARALAQRQAIEARLAEQIKRSTETNIQRSRLRSLQSSADAYRNIYENFLQRYTQAMQDQSFPISDARLASAAVPPTERSSPRVPIVLAASLFLGLALGLAVAILREALDGRVRTSSQLRNATGLPVLGLVPQLRTLRVERGWHPEQARLTGSEAARLQLPPAFTTAARGYGGGITDAVRAVQAAAARQGAKGHEVRIIGCVGVERGEGATTFAANLAAAMAASGRRTILVDLDQREAGLSRWLAPGAELGFGDVARNPGLLKAATLTDPATGLRFLPLSGAGYDRRLGIGELRLGISSLRSEADVIVLDLPPMDTQDSAPAISDLVDGLVLVARWGVSPLAQLTESMARLAPLDAMFLGAVLNGCNMRRMRSYGPEMAQMAVGPVVQVPVSA